MPKPVPPPPPQPSAEETLRAVRWVRIIAIVAVLLFTGWASTYSNSALLVQYGRDNAASWNLRKARTIRDDYHRAHTGGRIVWLVGSSIMRESFDQKKINKALTKADSEWRVLKFGQTRGAGGLSSGMLQHLPVRSGDLIVHNVAVENFHGEWLELTGLPDWRLLMLLDDPAIWSIQEWSMPQRLEAMVAYPRAFYSYQEEAMEGLVRWFNAPVWGWPNKRNRSFHTRFRRKKDANHRELNERDDLLSQYFIAGTDLDFSTDQFNHQGIERMRAFAKEHGAEFALIAVPQRVAYRDQFVSPEAQDAWSGWQQDQADLVVFPQPADGDFYDMKHPNTQGRALLSHYLVQWLDARWVQPPVDFVSGWQQRAAPPAKSDESGLDRLNEALENGP